MNVPHDQPESAKAPDLTLVLARLEREVVFGEQPEKCRRVLGDEGIWKQAAPDIQLRRARLAQMAGETEIALDVLARLNTEKSELIDAWIERLDLLLILDQREELARVLALARPHIGEKRHQDWIQTLRGTDKTRVDPVADAVVAPFENLRRRQEQVARFLDLFSGREDCFARQWVDRQEGKQGYVPVRRPMEPTDVEEHLSRRKTYGIYLLQSDAQVRLAVLDADLARDFRQGRLSAADKQLVRRERNYLLARIKELAETIGLHPATEFSGGKGFHFWFFFEPPVHAALARSVLEPLRQSVAGDLKAFNLEVFPKQESLSGKGFGNLVKLPLGIHRLTGKPSFFLECRDRSQDSQLNFLFNIQRAAPDLLEQAGRAAKSAEVVVHPRFRQWAAEYPELSQLESCCPPLAQIMAACRAEKRLTLREEKVILQTLSFLPRAKVLVHHLMGHLEDYNPHLVDYKLSRVRGTPLGCRRIHGLLTYSGEFCRFETGIEYAHPLLHLAEWCGELPVKAEKAENLATALDNLKLAISQLQRFMR